MSSARRANQPRRSPRSRLGALDGVQRQLLEERAYALGRAGRRLERALGRWRRVERDGELAGRERDAALAEVRDATYALLVQRDCTGFRMDNLAWIRRHYDIPEQALRRI